MPGHIAYTEAPHKDRQDWRNLGRMLPLLWDYRGRVLAALLCLILAKLANVSGPVQRIHDFLQG